MEEPYSLECFWEACLEEEEEVIMEAVSAAVLAAVAVDSADLAEDFQAVAVHQEDFNISELSELSNH